MFRIEKSIERESEVPWVGSGGWREIRSWRDRMQGFFLG
jgi:hypothetical protein